MSDRTPHDVVPETPLALLPTDSALAEHVRRLPAFTVPWDRLADTSGWLVWLGHPPVPDGLPLLPIREDLLWDEPAQTLAVVAAISLSYAHSRGATNRFEIRRILHREAPVAVLVPDTPHASLLGGISALREIGVPLLEASDGIANRVRQIPAFNARSVAHTVDLGMRHDPVFSFLAKRIESAETVGDNSLSSFILHSEGERDGLSVTGDLSERIGIEIGVSAEGIGIAETAVIERDAASYPSFFEFATSQLVGNQLQISWDAARPLSATQIGEVFRVWLKALWNIPLVDVRLAFAPSHGRSALLVDMRARAQQYRAIRDEMLRGEADQK